MELTTAPPPGVTRILLARHGATAANELRPYILQGSELNGPLSPNGEAQARALGAFLAPFQIDAVYCSPLVRARQTAEIAAGSTRSAPTTVPELRECSVGRWEGKDWETIKQADTTEYERVFADPATIPHPGGESFQDVLLRVKPALEMIYARHVGQTVLIVAHNLVNRVYLSTLLGVELRNARSLRQNNCCINLLEHQGDKTELVTLNNVMYL